MMTDTTLTEIKIRELLNDYNFNQAYEILKNVRHNLEVEEERRRTF